MPDADMDFKEKREVDFCWYGLQEKGTVIMAKVGAETIYRQRVPQGYRWRGTIIIRGELEEIA